MIRGDQEAIEKTKLRHAVSTTVDELLGTDDTPGYYDQSGAAASETTRKQNKHALRQFLREGATADGSAPITVIDDGLSRAWFTAAAQRALALKNDPRAVFTLQTGYPVLDSNSNGTDGHFKDGDWSIRVRALDPWYSILMTRIAAKGWRGEDDAPILEGTKTYVTDTAYRRVSAWMRGLGWRTQKTNHALRAYAGSQLFMKYGPYEAQCWLRHSSVLVTESHYSQSAKVFRPENPDMIPARWATLERPEPQLRVLPQLA